MPGAAPRTNGCGAALVVAQGDVHGLGEMERTCGAAFAKGCGAALVVAQGDVHGLGQMERRDVQGEIHLLGEVACIRVLATPNGEMQTFSGTHLSFPVIRVQFVISSCQGPWCNGITTRSHRVDGGSIPPGSIDASPCITSFDTNNLTFHQPGRLVR